MKLRKGITMITQYFLSLCLLLIPNTIQASDGVRIERLKITTRSAPPGLYSIEKPKGNSSTISIDLESDSDQLDIQIVASDRKVKLRVEQRFETSLSVQNEGPHLDLVNWKHYVSSWKEISANGHGIFNSKLISNEESKRFPAVDIADVVEEIKRRDPKWLSVIKNAKSLGEYPFSISVSTLSFRISEWVNSRWVPIHVIHCRRPMGC